MTPNTPTSAMTPATTSATDPAAPAPAVDPTVLHHVGAYATAVRARLADLPSDQVEDLTDGLEADLAEALADGAAAECAGDTASGAEAAGAAPSTTLDLTARFGSAAAYAAELRAAAGLAAAEVRVLGRARRRGERVVAGVEAAVAVVRRRVGPIVASPGGRTVIGLVDLVRPLWWVARGWLWFVLASLAVDTLTSRGVPAARSVWRFVPDGPVPWILAAVALGVSLAVGRRPVTGRAERAVVVGFSAVAVLALPWAATSLQDAVEMRLDRTSVVTQQVPVGVPVPSPVDDGVWVDGIRVSNLFVYDAHGTPLQGVQVFDDRGRPVQTLDDGGWGPYALPGVVETWSFAAAHDVDGRARWNVYPLVGAPAEAWDPESGGAAPVLLGGASLRVPPAPFAKAPSVVVGAPGVATEGLGSTFTATAEPGGS